MSEIWIIDFGSQYTQLITRKTRELEFLSYIYTYEQAITKIQAGEVPLALVLSGGPQSVFEDESDFAPLFNLNIPVLGICYGLQIIAHYFQGKVERGTQGEYGLAQIHSENNFSFENMPSSFKVWMSHFDHVTDTPKGFEIILKSENNIIAGISSLEKKIMAVQFHPEVEHTQYGLDLLRHFFTNVAGLQKNWSGKAMLENCLDQIEAVKDSKVLCAFSGGVDSLVAATMAHQVLGKNLYCFFVDNGLLRPQDYHHIETLKENTPLQIEIIDAKDLFLNSLKDIDDPEKKRKMIGATFIDVFETKVHEFERDHQIHFDYLLQGTLYPDVIESISPHQKGGKSVTIKSHHNVGGLPDRMKLKLLEPLRYLFKDEVRTLGETLGLDSTWVHRHPFPGPGIGIRVLGALSEESITKVQHSDQILFEELNRENLYQACWQAFTVLLPVKTVGVKGDARAYEEVICVRIVDSSDGMTANWTELPYSFLGKVSRRITNEVKGVTRVVYDITAKPPGTIEWE
jgi:GMP synthase (glutamine-hydrolysing)